MTSISQPTDSNPLMTTLNQELAETWSLVLSAVAIPHQIIESGNGFELFVENGNADHARSELTSYFQENRNWPPKAPTTDDFKPFFHPPSLLLMAGLMFFYSVTGPWDQKSIWFLSGAGETTAILNHFQWWRLVTALTLHADIVHVTGNCLLGAILIHFFCQMTGNGLGLFSLLVSAAGGNLVNSYVKGPGYSFVGFSTAAFAAIGMLAMLSYHEKKHLRTYHFLMPFMAGAALLAMLGSSGERTDLGAHFFGLGCGLFTGWLLTFSIIQKLRHSALFQSTLFSIFFIIITVSWHLALASNG